MPAVATAGGLPNRLGKYELLLPLAAGGMARIYIGRSTGIGSFERHVVLKLITPERANDHTAVQMFLDEARLAASLNHQNVAQVFEVGEDLGIHYLAMEYVHGQDLRALLAKAGSQGTRIPLELALTVSAGAAAGLNHAHERRGPDGVPLGIVHRDVSPSNIMIGYDGAVKLLDFGIAKATHRSVETQSGIIKGKFAYMAPEQCRGRDVDRRSDVFSLGIILYEITTQHRCFRADSDFDTMHRIVTGDVVRPTRLIQGYPQALEAIVMKALAVDASQRYQSAGLLLEAIESFAVSARMAMSTMSLGRFMRELFGEIQEPWLQQNRNMQPIQAKESTISSTDGRSNVAAPAIGRMPPEHEPSEDSAGVPDEDARFPDSAGVQAARTVLDLPRRPGDQEHQDPPPAEWNAKSYPAMQPAIASNATLPPDAIVRPSYPQMPGGVHPTPSLGGAPHPGIPTPAQGHPQQPPSGQFSQSPSGSHSNAAINAIPSTRHGYASGASGAHPRSDLSYPRYEPPIADPADVQLTPDRRPLYIGLGIAALGFIVILAVALGGKKDEPAAAPETGSDVSGGGSDEVKAVVPVAPVTPQPIPKVDNGSAHVVEPKSIETKGSAAIAPHTNNIATNGSDAVEVVDDTITITIDSDPHGADVLLGGTKIGTTPLSKKYKRSMGIAILTIRKPGYADATSRMDLAGDFSKPKVELKKDKTDDKPPVEIKTTKTDTHKTDTHKIDKSTANESHKLEKTPTDSHKMHNGQGVDTTGRTKPKCQPTGNYSPFDTTCGGNPCPPCSIEKTEPKVTDKPKTTIKKCQPPGQQNPFDTSCDGGPCPVCK